MLDEGKLVGRLYQRHTAASPEVIWHWSITEYVEPRAGLRTSGTAGTLDAAKAAFQESRDKWRAWATKAGFDSCAGSPNGPMSLHLRKKLRHRHLSSSFVLAHNRALLLRSSRSRRPH